VSHVSSMVVTCSAIEEDEDGGLPALHDWCASLERPVRFGTLDDDPAVCQSKAMQVLILACAANYFDEDALVEAFPRFPWLLPEDAVLVIHPEHGGTRIVRGGSR